MTTPTGEPETTASIEPGLFERELQQILDQVDREKLRTHPLLLDMSHPLLKARIGDEVMINTHIHNMITSLVEAITIDESILNRDQLAANAEDAEEILIAVANSPEIMRAALSGLLGLVRDTHSINKSFGPTDAIDSPIDSAVAKYLREKLTMPNMAQEYVTFPAAIQHILGELPSDILEGMQEIRARFLPALAREGRADVFEAEFDAVKAWLESLVAQSEGQSAQEAK